MEPSGEKNVLLSHPALNDAAQVHPMRSKWVRAHALLEIVLCAGLGAGWLTLGFADSASAERSLLLLSSRSAADPIPSLIVAPEPPTGSLPPATPPPVTPPPAEAPTSRPAAPAAPGESPAVAAPGLDERGFITVGTVRFHPQRRELEADGYFNLQAGFLEFLACAPSVKSHETLVSLECEAEHLKAGLLLLGLQEGRRPESELDLAPLDGDRVIILLRWQETTEDGTSRTIERRAEDCILNGLVSDTMERVGWVFTGSMFIEEAIPPPLPDRSGQSESSDPPTIDPPDGGSRGGAGPEPDGPAPAAASTPKTRTVFAAAETGQYITICHRPWAILDNPLGLPFPDGDYYAYPDMLPRVDRDDPVEVTLVFRRPREGEIDRTITTMRVPPRPAHPPGGLPEEPATPPTPRPGGGD